MAGILVRQLTAALLGVLVLVAPALAESRLCGQCIGHTRSHEGGFISQTGARAGVLHRVDTGHGCCVLPDESAKATENSDEIASLADEPPCQRCGMSDQSALNQFVLPSSGDRPAFNAKVLLDSSVPLAVAETEHLAVSRPSQTAGPPWAAAVDGPSRQAFLCRFTS